MGEISTSMEDKQRKRSYIFNIAVVVIAALALASMIGTLSVLSLPLSTIIMTSAQASSSSPTSGSIISSSSSGSWTDKQMGICVVGVESPCNGDR
jgi:hypothetical protein